MSAQTIREPEAWQRWGWLVASVAKRYGVTVDDVLGRRRHQRVAHARRDLCACLRGSGLAYAEIGRMLGLDHCTVMTAVRKDLAS